ncbi:MAG: 16S rRNA (uracil(1498)-N(3))-methyltransferase [Ekhidna sp.]
MNTFYQKDIQSDINTLSPEESRHCTQVLRHKVGDVITIFDGNGGKHEARLKTVHKNGCEFEIVKSQLSQPKAYHIHLIIAPTKNIDRIEWLIEKLGEIGVDEVSFIITKHSERRKLRMDRLEKKAVSAMKQSGNPWKTKLNDLNDFKDTVSKLQPDTLKYIAHVDQNHEPLISNLKPDQKVEILVGPEGDFSEDEVAFAKANGFIPVSLGPHILRTETAGFVACCNVNFINDHHSR